MVGIGASQAPQSESSPESRLSYPANTINSNWSAGPRAPQSYPDSYFCLKKLLVLRESWLEHAGTLCKGLMEAWWRWSVPCVLYSGCKGLFFFRSLQCWKTHALLSSTVSADVTRPTCCTGIVLTLFEPGLWGRAPSFSSYPVPVYWSAKFIYPRGSKLRDLG